MLVLGGGGGGGGILTAADLLVAPTAPAAADDDDDASLETAASLPEGVARLIPAGGGGGGGGGRRLFGSPDAAAAAAAVPTADAPANTSRRAAWSDGLYVVMVFLLRYGTAESRGCDDYAYLEDLDSRSSTPTTASSWSLTARGSETSETRVETR